MALWKRPLLAVMSLAGALMVAGCAYDDGYYGGVGIGSGYYGGGYYDSYYPGYGYGWYDGYYYPGSGYYVYDRGGRRHRWNDGQRRYWEGRRAERRDDRWRGGSRDGWRGNDGKRWQGRDRDGRREGDWNNRPRTNDGNRNRWRGGRDAVSSPRGQARPEARPARPDSGQRHRPRAGRRQNRN